MPWRSPPDCSKEGDRGAGEEKPRKGCLSCLHTRPCQLDVRIQPVRHRPPPSAWNVVSAQISLVSMKNNPPPQQQRAELGGWHSALPGTGRKAGSPLRAVCFESLLLKH